jgi:hypothetical protein
MDKKGIENKSIGVLMIITSRLFWFFIISLSFVNPFATLFAQGTIVQDKTIRDVAREELLKFLDKIPVGQEMLYGFENREQFKSVTIGKPLQILSLSTETYSIDYANTSIKILPHDEWFVPLIVQNTIKAIITVTKHEGRLQAVDFGAKDLADELNTFKEITAKNNSIISILRVYRLQCDFLVLPTGSKTVDQNLIIPLKSAQIALFNDTSYKAGFNEREVILLIQEKLKLLPNEENNR